MMVMIIIIIIVTIIIIIIIVKIIINDGNNKNNNNIKWPVLSIWGLLFQNLPPDEFKFKFKFFILFINIYFKYLFYNNYYLLIRYLF